MNSFKTSGSKIVRGLFPAVVLLLLVGTADAQDQQADDDINPRITITALITDDGWGNALRSPSSMFFDEHAHELLVTDGGNNRVVVYDANLSPRFSFYHYVLDPRSRRRVKGEPRDLVVNRRGEIVLVDNLVPYLEVLDFRGRPLEKIDLTAALGDTALNIRPQCLSIDSADNIYVAVSGDLPVVLVLDEYFSLKRVIRSEQGAPSGFNTILALYTSGSRLYVTDLYAEPAIKVFDTTGEYISGFGAHDIERTDFSFPSGIVAFHDKPDRTSIWVVDGLRQIVKVFAENGDLLAFVGGFGVKPGEFRYPADIAVAGDSVFYTVERVGNRIQRFRISK